jgi:O-antigen ligase
VDNKGLKIALSAAVVLLPLLLLGLAYSRPAYFTSQIYLGGLVLIEFLLVAIWNYRRMYFALLILSFLFAGLDLPLGGFWTAGRWGFLGMGALVGSLMILKDRQHRFHLFHIVAMFAAFTAAVSAAVSRYQTIALLKALSLFLLFLYGATGARLAVAGRETRFFNGLVTGCEILVGMTAALYAIGMEPMGNPNSLGALMGVAAAPVLLWGALVTQDFFLSRRRWVMFVICLGLVFYSRARAGMAAAAISSALLCLSLRKYKLLTQGIGIILILVAVVAIVAPERFSNSVSDLSSEVLYKGRAVRGEGVLGSRESPWQDSIDTIRTHFWFGTGFGTADNGKDASAHLGSFSSTQDVNKEHGSSYLAVTTWVGMMGVPPFLLLMMVIIVKVYRTVVWMISTGDGRHPAIPLAMIMVAGMIHAGLEDWLFAPGYYLSVFFWSMAFVLMDLAPEAPLTRPRMAFSWRLRSVRQSLGGVAPSR